MKSAATSVHPQRAAFGLLVLSLLVLAGCTTQGPDESDSVAFFPDHEGCQLQYPDDTSVECDGVAQPFVSGESQQAWLCVWEFRGGGYDGVVLQSADLEHAAVRLTGPQPPEGAQLAATLRTESGEHYTFAGTWDDGEQTFSFAIPSDERGRLFVLGLIDHGTLLDGEAVATETVWGHFDGIPSPIVRLPWNGSSYHFLPFEGFGAGNATWVPAINYQMESEPHVLEVRRDAAIQVSTAVGAGWWANLCEVLPVP